MFYLEPSLIQSRKLRLLECVYMLFTPADRLRASIHCQMYMN